MSLESLTLENFRSYRNKTVIDLEKPINVFIGRNNTGKSNIFEFLRWVAGPFTGQPVRQLSEYIHTGNTTSPFRVSFILKIDDSERAKLVNNTSTLQTHFVPVLTRGIFSKGLRFELM